MRILDPSRGISIDLSKISVNSDLLKFLTGANSRVLEFSNSIESGFAIPIGFLSGCRMVSNKMKTIKALSELSNEELDFVLFDNNLPLLPQVFQAHNDLLKKYVVFSAINKETTKKKLSELMTKQDAAAILEREGMPLVAKKANKGLYKTISKFCRSGQQEIFNELREEEAAMQAKKEKKKAPKARKTQQGLFTVSFTVTENGRIKVEIQSPLLLSLDRLEPGEKKNFISRILKQADPQSVEIARSIINCQDLEDIFSSLGPKALTHLSQIDAIWHKFNGKRKRKVDEEEEHEPQKKRYATFSKDKKSKLINWYARPL